jgi:hypothetical protein
VAKGDDKDDAGRVRTERLSIKEVVVIIRMMTTEKTERLRIKGMVDKIRKE